MVNCGVCRKVFTSKQLKVNCTECNVDFHGACVKMNKADIDYLTSEGSVWRCDPCSVARRSSLLLQSQASQGSLTLEDIMQAIRELTKSHEQATKDFNTSYEALNEKVEDNTRAMKEQTATIKKYMDMVESLDAENKRLKEKVQILEDRLDESEQYSRRNCVEIQGAPITRDALTTVKDIGTALGMEIKDDLVDACHALGKKPNSDDPPGIIVKFVRRIDADMLLSLRRKKRQFSTRHLNLASDRNIYINESLSPARRRLLGQARAFKRDNNWKWIWVRGGKIFLKKEDNGPTIIVRSQADIDNL